MRTFEQWMAEYGESHQNKTNQMIHKVCVPLITWSVLALLWVMPVPALFAEVPFLNWAVVFSIAALLFYATLSWKMFWGMLIQSFLMLGICYQIERVGGLWQIALVVFGLAWIGQFIGHKIEGKKPSFFKDLLFLLIGPLWVLRFLYQKLGIVA